MAKRVDGRGLKCPAPVLLVKDAVEQGGRELDVLVDNAASLENVTRFLGSRGYMVEERQEEEAYRITARSDEDISGFDRNEASDRMDQEADLKIVVLVTSDCLGSGDEILGAKLMASYLKTVKEMGKQLWQLIFLNGGVKLTTAFSPVLEDLQGYERAGITILACGTCLEHYGLMTEKKVGTTTNMLDIVTATQLAHKVITIG